MSDGILVLNAGSSSIKFSLFTKAEDGGEPTLVSKGQVEGIGTDPHFIALGPDGEKLEEKRWEDAAVASHPVVIKYVIDWLEEHLGDATLIAAGHRVVHGGLGYTHPVRVDLATMTELEKLVPLAPLHQPHNLNTMKAVMDVHPELPQIACFDTSFHRSNPDVFQKFAIPRKLTEEGVRRYGFHGLSYEYIAKSLPEFAPELAGGKVVVMHLGSGASACGIDNGKSISSTMGFTALDGLVMGTRPGNIDPGVVLYLMQEHNLSAKEIEKVLYKESGLKGASGISNDMRDLLGSDNPDAKEAVDIFIARITREIGSLAAAMGGIDGLVFTAGIGEHSRPIRRMVCEKAAWLGVEIDLAANEANGPKISSASSKLPVYVIPTNEELMIAIHTLEVMG